MPTLYVVDEDYMDEMKIEIQSVKVKKIPTGYKAITRSGLAFGCRTMFKPDSFARTKVDAVRRYIKYRREAIRLAHEEIATNERNLKAAQVLLKRLGKLRLDRHS